MGDTLPPFTIIMDETHTTAYYHKKEVGTLYHAAESDDLPWYIM